MDDSNAKKHIKLVILKTLLILGLCNFKFPFEIP